jgi:hypothetical protein
MPQFAILELPSANRVYTRSAVQMMSQEITIFGRHLLENPVEDIAEQVIGGVPYLTFQADALSDQDIGFLSNISSLYALFAVHGNLLEPITISKLDRYPDDLITILKYAGKTNENFTKLLLNVTAAVLGPPSNAAGGGLKVFDPMCGRGTTLNQAVMYGFDAYGVDVDGRDVELYTNFLLQWLKNNLIKHKAVKSRVRRDGQVLGQRTSVEFAATKEQYKAGHHQKLEITNADTLGSGKIYRKEFFDLIVTDAPYGVQHGAVGNSRSLSRSPTALLASAIPVWSGLLRGGGAIGLSWNTYMTSRRDLRDLLLDAGLEIMDELPAPGFEHRVDHAIVRDLIVARKPR